MRVLRFGSRGASVQLLQLALNRAGFGPLAVDGIFGSATRTALQRFQMSRGLTADGVAGPLTHRALRPWYEGWVSHRLQRGDTLWILAELYGSSVAAILTANPAIQPENLSVGETLVIPLSFPVVPESVDVSSALVEVCVRGLTARYPFLQRGSVGQSVLGRPLWRITLGTGENRVLYNASHHANEWLTTLVLLRFAEELAAANAGGGEIFGVEAAQILDYATLCLIPAVNPDGIDLVTGDLEGTASYRTAQAIGADYPRFPFPRGWKANIQGIDLNLQYPAGWEHARENKYAQGIVSPAPADFVGPAPLSASEARALYDFTLRFDPALILAYHSQGEVIYWKYLDFEPENSRQIAELFADVSGYTAEETPYASAFAGYKDWFIQDFDRPGYTIEVGRGVNPLPIGDLSEIYRRNLGILTLGALVS